MRVTLDWLGVSTLPPRRRRPDDLPRRLHRPRAGGAARRHDGRRRDEGRLRARRPLALRPPLGARGAHRAQRADGRDRDRLARDRAPAARQGRNSRGPADGRRGWRADRPRRRRARAGLPEPALVHLGDDGWRRGRSLPRRPRHRAPGAHAADGARHGDAALGRARRGRRGAHEGERPAAARRGGSLAYLIETPAGSILWKDSSGHWSGIRRDLRPDLALLAAVGRGNAGRRARSEGTLAGFVASEVELLRPSVVLCHHDDWMPPLTTPIDVAPIRRELASRTPGARLVEMGYLEGADGSGLTSPRAVAGQATALQ